MATRTEVYNKLQALNSNVFSVLNTNLRKYFGFDPVVGPGNALEFTMVGKVSGLEPPDPEIPFAKLTVLGGSTSYHALYLSAVLDVLGTPNKYKDEFVFRKIEDSAESTTFAVIHESVIKDLKAKF